MEAFTYMKLAIEEAKISLWEGNKGFGAVIIKDGQVIASAHDIEHTEGDAASHAQIKQIDSRLKFYGSDYLGGTSR